MFELIQCPKDQAEEPVPWQLRFSQVAFMVQMPHLSLEEEATRVKGAPITEAESSKLHERAGYAKFWLATYAPDQFKYVLQQTMPAVELFGHPEESARRTGGFYRRRDKRGKRS